jgi:hypothetical protein
MKKRNDTRGLTFWKPAVLAWRRSGQTQREYCKHRGLNLHALRNWSRKVPGGVKVKPRGKVKAAKKFSSIRLMEANPALSQSGYELTLCHGQCLSLPVHCDVLHVAALVKALEA